MALPLAATQVPVVRGGLAALVDLMREGGALGVLAYLGVFAIGAMLAAPIALFSLMAGYAYGPLYGVVIASPAVAFASTTTFFLGRTVLRRSLQRRIDDNAKWRAIDRAIGENGFKIVALMRLSPIVPQNFLSYILSVTRVRALDFSAATLVGLFPIICLQVYVGSLVHDVETLFERDGLPEGPWTWVAPALGLVVTAATVIVTTRIAKKALDRAVIEANREEKPKGASDEPSLVT